MTIKVKVVPRASKFKIEPFAQGLKVYLTKSPVNNEANKQLVEIIADHYGVKKSQVSILKGHKNREKVLKITQ